jgi:RimJ/RimL family protein N-acetyltransferase
VRLILRRWREADLDSLIRLANNRRIWINLADPFPHPYTHADGQGWIALTAAEGDPQLQFAIDVDGQAIGGIGLKRLPEQHPQSLEVGYWVGEPYWGRGIASEALARVTEYAFNKLGAERVQAQVFAYNLASARVLEKNGYTLEGRLRRAARKDGQIIDKLMYSIIA